MSDACLVNEQVRKWLREGGREGGGGREEGGRERGRRKEGNDATSSSHS